MATLHITPADVVGAAGKENIKIHIEPAIKTAFLNDEKTMVFGRSFDLPGSGTITINDIVPTEQLYLNPLYRITITEEGTTIYTATFYKEDFDESLSECLRNVLSGSENAVRKPETGPQGKPGRDGIDGRDGRDGEDGKDGDTGADGTYWFNGSGAPQNVEHARNRDLYFDRDTADVYLYNGTAWTKIANQQGKQGVQGRYYVDIYQNAATLPTAPVGAMINADTGVVSLPQNSDWTVDLRPVADGENVYITRAVVDESVHSGDFAPEWSAVFEAGGVGPIGPVGPAGPIGPVGPAGDPATVKVDNETIEKDVDGIISVKNEGITTEKVKDKGITRAKFSDDALSPEQEQLAAVAESDSRLER